MKRIPGTVKKSLTAFWPSPGTKATDDFLYSVSPAAHGAGNVATSGSELTGSLATGSLDGCWELDWASDELFG